MRTNNFFAAVFCLLVPACVFADLPIIFDLKKAENEESISKTVHIATFPSMRRSAPYSISGQYRCENVEGKAHLEAWAVYPDGARKQLSDGPMIYVLPPEITGTSDWRDFEFPFNFVVAIPESVSLEINVVMPGKGKIELSGLRLSDRGVPAGQWFDGRTSGVIGGVLGAIGGIYGGVIGCLCGFLAPRGKGKRWIKGLFLSGIIFAIVYLIFGICALILGQPYHVWYPFVLVGGIMCFVMSMTFPQINRVYAQAELRKMQALDT